MASPIRMTGINSGLDTESIVTALTSGYKSKVDKYKQQQTKVSWKQDAWKGINKKVYSLYTSLDSMRFSANWKMQKATSSNTGVASITSNGKAFEGSRSIKVTNVATTANLTSGQFGSDVTGTTTLGDLNYSGGAGTISVNGKTISVNESTTINKFVSDLQDAGLNANFDSTNKRLYISAKKSGAANDFTFTGDGSGVDALSALNLISKSDTKSTAATDKYGALLTGLKTDENGALAIDGKAASDDDILALLKTNIDTAVKDYKEADTQSTNDKAAIDKNTKGLEYADQYKSLHDDLKKYSISEDDIKSLDTSSDDEIKKSSVYTKILNTEYPEGITDDDEKKDDKINDVISKARSLKDSYTKTDTLKGATDTTIAKNIEDDYQKNGNVDASVSDLTTSNTTLQTDLEKHQTTLNKYAVVADLAAEDTKIDSATFAQTVLNAFKGQASLNEKTSGNGANAVKLAGSSASITVDGVTYTQDSNNFSINGLSIQALTKGETTVTVSTDTQGLYDKIKNFFATYNDVINDLTDSYNAESSKGYDPLTDDQKSAMSDTEIEKWEKRAKGGLLRNDDTLNSIMNSITNTMLGTYQIGDKKYSLASFGIKTKGILNAATNRQYEYHIDGDEDDESVASNQDKLMAALTDDPDSVINFMQKLTNDLYTNLDKKMKRSSLKSAYTIYNDKEMASEYSSYTSLIKQWEDRLSTMEESYYKKFSKMESTLSKLQNSTSSLTNSLS